MPITDLPATDLLSTALPIRENLRSAHQHTVQRWAHPGAWWSGEQKLAIVEQVRACLDADPLPPWVKPSSVDGLLTSTTTSAATSIGVANGAVNGAPPVGAALPTAAIDAIWRITRHPGTLTRDWYEGVIADLAAADASAPEALASEAPAPEAPMPEALMPKVPASEALAYAELVAIVSQANNLDRFADALGLERLKLPEPEPGEPSRQVPESVAVRNHWVPTDDTPGPGVLLSLTAVPAEVEAWLVLSDAGYVPLENIRGDLIADHASLTRPQIELVAARTSKLNECFY